MRERERGWIERSMHDEKEDKDEGMQEMRRMV